MEFGGGRRWWKRYTRTWGRTGDRAWDLAVHALAEAPAWRAAIERWQAPDPGRRRRGPPGIARRCSTSSTSWSTAASFWEAGEVGGPEPGRRRPGPVRPARVRRLPVLRHGRRRLLRVVRAAASCSRSWSSAGSATCWPRSRSTTRRSSTIEASGLDGAAQGRRHRPARRRRPGRRPVLPAQLVPVPGRQRLEGSRPQVRPAGLARRGGGPDRGGDALIRDAFPDRRRGADPAGARDRDGDGLPGARWRARPDLRHVADARTVGLRRVALARRGRGRRGDGPAARRWRVPRAAGRAGSSAARSPSTDACGAATTTPTTTAAGPARTAIMADQLAGQWYADATGLGDLLPAERVETALRTIHARNVCGVRRRADGRRQRDAPGRHGRRVERAVGRGVGRDDLCAGRIHDRPRARRRGLGDGRAAPRRSPTSAACGSARPRRTTPNGDFRASIYLRPLAIWAIEEALRRRRGSVVGEAL